MSWLLKQAEDILNRVDQQTNAALHHDNSKLPPKQNQIEILPEPPLFTPTVPIIQPTQNETRTNRVSIPITRRTTKTDESELINYLNSPTPVKRISTSNVKSRTNSSSTDESSKVQPESVSNFPSNENLTNKEFISTIEKLTNEKNQFENQLQIYKRQQIQYQQQIAESDALLRQLRSHESDVAEILLAKDSQIALLRVRLNETDELLRMKNSQHEKLQNDYSNLLKDSSNIQSQSFDFLQMRIKQLEQELERNFNENERLNDENQQIVEQLKSTEKRLNDEHLQLYEQQQQTRQAKNLINQFEQDMNEYKIKAQRILQTKDKLINKLKDILQHRSSTPTIGDQTEIENIAPNDETTLLDISHVGNSSQSSNWASIQYEDLKNENDLFKQELQAREFTIHKLRNELQEAEILIQNNDEQYQEQINQMNGQLKDVQLRLTLAEQDDRKLKHQLTSVNDELNKQKQIYQGQIIEREHDIERLRLQLTSKTINHPNDDELEKRLQVLTESLIHKQTIIETLQTDKSSLTMQLERLEKRLDDYENITAKNSLQQSNKIYSPTSIAMDDNEQYENLRYRVPLLRETPYDVDLTKKVKRAANEIDKLGIRFISFLRRYPIVRLGILFYAIILHLWTFIVLVTYTPETHANINSAHLQDKL